MNIFSMKGINRINDYLKSKGLGCILDNNIQLRVDVNGESFFLTNNCLDDIENIALACGFDAEFTFSIHQNEQAYPVILNPLEDLSSEFMNWICSKLALNYCSVQLSENNLVNYSDFYKLAEHRLDKEKTFLTLSFQPSSISTDPLL